MKGRVSRLDLYGNVRLFSHCDVWKGAFVRKTLVFPVCGLQVTLGFGTLWRWLVV